MFSTFILCLFYGFTTTKIVQTENRRTCSYAEVQPIFATIRLQNNKKQHKKRLGEARKQVAEGATLKLVKEKSENKGSNRNDLSQKRVLFLFAEGELTASYSFLRGIVQARLPSALVSYVISLRSVLR